jgi:hypothetical protein
MKGYYEIDYSILFGIFRKRSKISGAGRYRKLFEVWEFMFIPVYKRYEMGSCL